MERKEGIEIKRPEPDLHPVLIFAVLVWAVLSEEFALSSTLLILVLGLLFCIFLGRWGYRRDVQEAQVKALELSGFEDIQWRRNGAFSAGKDGLHGRFYLLEDKHLKTTQSRGVWYRILSSPE